MARQNLRQSYIDAVTNRANTFNLNQMNPQFAVDPNTGGKMYGHDFKEIKPIDNQQDPVAALYDKYVEKYGPEKALELMKLKGSGRG